jgi:WD40 repeat protein
VFHPSDKILATGSFDKTVHLWDITNPREPKLMSSPTDVGDGGASLAFSPDGRKLASGEGDSAIRLWDVSNPNKPELIAFLRGHTGKVESVAFNSDGHTIVSGSWDHTAQIWETDTNSIIERICATTTYADADAGIEWNHQFPGDRYKSPCLN